MIIRKSRYKQCTITYSKYVELFNFLSQCDDKNYQAAIDKLDKFKVIYGE